MARRKLTALNIAFLYVGTLMGAGFASGREIWQFFGVFGEKSYPAILTVTVFFIIFGMMTVKISETMDTTDIGKIIMPFENKSLENFFGTVIAAILFLVYTVMAAAGGALFQEQFGFNKAIGGAILMILIIATTLGGFERISKNFKFLIPLLLFTVFLVCLNILFRDLPSSGIPAAMVPSPLAPYWHSAAFVYISYNMLAGIPIMASSTRRAKSEKTALTGAAIGGLLLGLAAFVMNLAMLTDAGLSESSVLPVLVLSGKLSGTVRWIYAILLLFAVYSTATSNFYGFTTRIAEGPRKKYLIIAAAVAGFGLSLLGFAEIIAVILPLEGYFGVLFLSFMTVHYFQIRKQEKEDSMTRIEKSKAEAAVREEEASHRFEFPDGIRRVTAGKGGEALLIIGSDKTALIDCGMAFCGETLVENIKNELGDRPLDYVILTHTHYDHIGGLPYLRREWPALTAFGAEYAKKVLGKESALHQIEIMSKAAWKHYALTDRKPEILMEGMRVDRIVCEKDIISLGDKELQIIVTPGHTDCSLALLQLPDKILFASETIGVYTGRGSIAIGMLKSCRQSIESIEKCRNIDAAGIISPHYGMVPDYDAVRYWDLAMDTLILHRDFVLRRVKAGVSFEKIMEDYTKEFYTEQVSGEQPKEAFLLNAHHMIHNLIKEFHE